MSSTVQPLCFLPPKMPWSPYCRGFTGVASFLCNLSGGGEENRTPVQKPLTIAFYGCILSITFPRQSADKQAESRSILWCVTDYEKAHPYTFTANRRPTEAAVFPGQTAALITQRKQLNSRQLILWFQRLKCCWDHYPLTMTYNPCRNHCAPLYYSIKSMIF